MTSVADFIGSVLNGQNKHHAMKQLGHLQIRAALQLSLPEGDDENSPGWSPRTRTEPWESDPKETAPSRRDGRNSPPNIARIVFDAVLLEKGDVLSLEITCAMMLFLACDVFQGRANLRPSDRERAITFLPFKAFDLAGLMHPERGYTFDFPHCRGYRHRRRQRKQEMNVVLYSADAKRLHLVLARDASHVGPQTRLDFCDDGLAPLLGGEDTMEDRATVGV